VLEQRDAPTGDTDRHPDRRAELHRHASPLAHFDGHRAAIPDRHRNRDGHTLQLA
jgi:hypothetical protein